MKKTVQIVTIPLDKKGFSINDLIKKPAFDAAGEIERWKISYYGMSTGIWKAHQLLVLSDDEIKINDTYYASGSKTLEYSVFKADTARLVKIGNELGVKKVIASYPQIEGTLAISKETVQAWIDSGTPGKGSLEMEEHPMNKATFAQNMYQLKLTPDNEVVIVDEPNIVEMTLKATTLSDDFVDQELQDVANKYAGSIVEKIDPDDISLSSLDLALAVKFGADWKAEQVANDSIEFAEWTHAWSFDKINKIWSSSNGQEYTSKQLYELWQQRK